MAEKRMFSKKVVETDAFLDMPDSTQNLYFHLSINADDDGFVVNPKSLMRMLGKKEDDLRLLAQKEFIIPFRSGCIVIRHWCVNNNRRADRYNPTANRNEMDELTLGKDGVYYIKNNVFDMQEQIENIDGIPAGNQLATNGIPTDATEEKRREENNISSLRSDMLLCDTIGEKEHGSNKKNDIFTTLLLKGSEEAEVTYDVVEEFKALFPLVNVEQEIRNAKSWLKSHPERRKTDWYRFLANWLRKESRDAEERRQARQGCSRDYNPENRNVMKEAEDVQI